MATYYYWAQSGAVARANSTAYSLGARIVIAQGDTAGNFAVARRFVWEVTTAGTTGAAVPVWPSPTTADVTTLTDGTVTYTARTPGYSSGSTVNWSFATIYFLYAYAAANVADDTILVHYTSQENLTADTTYILDNNFNMISVNKDNANTPTPMDVNGWIGSNGTSRLVALRGTFTTEYYFYGVTFRPNGNDFFAIGTNSTEGHFEFESCYFYSVGAGGMLLGSTTIGGSIYAKLLNCTIRFNATTDSLLVRAGEVVLEGCTISTLGARPSILFQNSDTAGSGQTTIMGCDLSYVTGTLVGSIDLGAKTFTFIECKLGAGVTVLAAQSPPNKSSAIVYVNDCSSGDTHTFMGYYDALGSCVSDTGIYYTTGAAGQSWKIVTTANCNFYYPFVGPFVNYYYTGTSAITPYFEILRDGSATAFQNDEVWADFFVKVTSGSTQSTEYSDRMALLGTPTDQPAGAGTASWTGEQATAWSGKIDSGTAVTPAEVGAIMGRVVVGEPSITVYVDPQIRT